MVHQNTAGWTRGDEAAQERRLGDLAWERLTRRLAWATLALLVAYTAWYLLRYSDFNNDDLDNFMFMRSTGFWQFVLTPTNVHYVPLHRLLTWLVYHLDPMNFAVAVAVLMAFHLGTLVYLARSLHLLGLGLRADRTPDAVAPLEQLDDAPFAHEARGAGDKDQVPQSPLQK